MYTFISTDIKKSSILWNAFPELMFEKVLFHNSIIIKWAEKYKGKILPNSPEGDAYIIYWNSETKSNIIKYAKILQGLFIHYGKTTKGLKMPKKVNYDNNKSIDRIKIRVGIAQSTTKLFENYNYVSSCIKLNGDFCKDDNVMVSKTGILVYFSEIAENTATEDEVNYIMVGNNNEITKEKYKCNNIDVSKNKIIGEINDYYDNLKKNIYKAALRDTYVIFIHTTYSEFINDNINSSAYIDIMKETNKYKKMMENFILTNTFIVQNIKIKRDNTVICVTKDIVKTINNLKKILKMCKSKFPKFEIQIGVAYGNLNIWGIKLQHNKNIHFDILGQIANESARASTYDTHDDIVTIGVKEDIVKKLSKKYTKKIIKLKEIRAGGEEKKLLCTINI